MKIYKRSYKYWADVHALNEREDVKKIGEVFELGRLTDLMRRLAKKKELRKWKVKPFLTFDRFKKEITIHAFRGDEGDYTEYIFKVNRFNKADRALFAEWVKFQTGNVFKSKWPWD